MHNQPALLTALQSATRKDAMGISNYKRLTALVFGSPQIPTTWKGVKRPYGA
jgi:hypothetical protein